MKKSLRFILFLTASYCAHGHAQEVRTPPTTTVAAIPAPVIDEVPAEPPAPVVKPDFRVEGTQSKSLYVVEAPPMPGLPPVEGVITLTVQSVADPGLPDPPPPAPAVIPEGAEPQGRFAEAVEQYRETRFAFVSATVYDRTRTRLTCHGHGGNAVTVWSNIDFNHFCGLGSFVATGADGEVRSYHFHMGIGNEDTGRKRDSPATEEIGYDGPAIPALPDGAPAFVIVSDSPDPATLTLIEDLHALYRTEGKGMAEASAAREKAYEERKSHLLAHPPKPKDVTVNFWKRNTTHANPEGGRP